MAIFISACGDISSPPPQFSNTNNKVYIVQSGDTLYGLSTRFGVSQNDIARSNGLKSAFLFVGQKLLIPDTGRAANQKTEPQIYVVKRGDFLSKIAKKYGTTVAKIKQINGLTSDIIYPNQRLIIGGEAVKTAAKIPPPPIVSTGQFMMPINGKQIVNFGTYKNGAKIEGINISAPLGTIIKSADSGRVVYTGDAIGGYGKMILVSHAKGYVTVYAHLNSFAVNQGSTVKKGQILGTVGTSGEVNRPQLHFQLRLNQKPLNPNKYLK